MPPAAARVALACAHCDARFERLPCQLTRGRGRYCSSACSRAATRRQEIVQCAGCGATFTRAPSQRGQSDYCTRACYDAARDRAASTYRKIGDRHEHRLVAERVLGRPLGVDEIVHHRDGDKRNNAPANLEILTQSEHAKRHAADGTFSRWRRPS